jgi:hypothetical protein
VLDNSVEQRLAVLEHIRQPGDRTVDPELFEQSAALLPRVAGWPRLAYPKGWAVRGS